VFVTFVGSVPSIGAAILVINEADRFNGVDLHRELDVFQDHLVIMHTSLERNDIEVIVSKPDRDPRLQEF